jgi:hypothetical protein
MRVSTYIEIVVAILLIFWNILYMTISNPHDNFNNSLLQFKNCIAMISIAPKY